MNKESEPRNQFEFRKSDEQIDYNRIDLGIRELVRRLNGLSFVYTRSSCEGHLLSQAFQTLPESGHSFITAGHLIFDVDKNNPKASLFLEKINELIEKYPFAYTYEHHCNEYECLIEGSQCVDLDYSDLTHVETINDTDSLEDMVKKRRQVPTEIGQVRIEEFKQFWHDLNKIAIEFLELSQ